MNRTTFHHYFITLNVFIREFRAKSITVVYEWYFAFANMPSRPYRYMWQYFVLDMQILDNLKTI